MSSGGQGSLLVSLQNRAGALLARSRGEAHVPLAAGLECLFPYCDETPWAGAVDHKEDITQVSTFVFLWACLRGGTADGESL